MKRSSQKVQAAAKAQQMGYKVKATMGKAMKRASRTKNSLKNDPHKPKEQGLKLDELYPKGKKAEKNYNELQKFQEQTSKARKDTPIRKTAGAKHDKNGLQNTQRK